MKVSELIEALEAHTEKQVLLGLPCQKEDGTTEVIVGPFGIFETKEGNFLIVPIDKAPKPGMTREMLEKLIPKTHLKPLSKDPAAMGFRHPGPLEKIHADVDAIVAYMEEHNLMSEINRRSGQENDIRYFAYAIQAYYMGVLR